jgi:hypothetical protein
MYRPGMTGPTIWQGEGFSVNLLLGRFYEYRVRGLVALGFRPVAEFRNLKIGNRRVLVMELRLAG